MDDELLPADSEEQDFRKFLEDPAGSPSARFQDPHYARCADAIRDLLPPPEGGRLFADVTPLDVAVLIRQVLRRASVRDGVPARLVMSDAPGLPSVDDWSAVGVDAPPAHGGGWLLTADPWRPDWLAASGDHPADAAAVAGSAGGRRVRFEALPADPVFTQCTGYPEYRTAGQRAAVRAALSLPPGGTLIALLPTGSGKTEVALTLARLARRQTTLIVVPTIALAYDFERRFRAAFAATDARFKKTVVPFAWTGGTDTATREVLRAGVMNGTQPLLVTSPESLTGTLLQTVRSAAGAGRLRGLVVDEAHLVTQWGRDFRPEFRQLGGLRRELLRRSSDAGHPGFTTLLLSATLGSAELEDLCDLFGTPGTVSLVAANQLRAEPEYWINDYVTRDERIELVLEAVRHLPRPLLLYVTQPADAQEWQQRLRSAGFRRLAVVTGQTAGEDRREVLEGLRAAGESRSRYDLVIATSAFGLGIDNDQIRSVVHACLPETIDRWYQEVGRAGRDGHASVALLLPAYGDDDQAASLGIKMLTPETAQERWTTLWTERAKINGRNYVDLHRVPPGKNSGSYNRRWNAQILRGLEDLDQLSRTPLSYEQALGQGLTVEGPERHEWEQVELEKGELHEQQFYETRWDEWRLEVMAQSGAGLREMKAVVRGDRSVCRLIVDAYTPNPVVRERFGDVAGYISPVPPCGRCPECRRLGVFPLVDPPPHPPNQWDTAVVADGAIEELLRSCPTGERLAVVVADDPTAHATRLAEVLVAHGVRLLAGVKFAPAAAGPTWWFTDSADARLGDLPPVPAFFVLRDGQPLDVDWLVPDLRPVAPDGRPTPAVILLRAGTRIGNSERAVETLPVLPVEVALKIIGGWKP